MTEQMEEYQGEVFQVIEEMEAHRCLVPRVSDRDVSSDILAHVIVRQNNTVHRTCQQDIWTVFDAEYLLRN